MRTWVVFVWMLCAGAAQAMEIGPGKPGLCLYTLSGQIAPGDADKLHALAFDRPVSWPDMENGRWAAICLDSPGGSLPAGLELAGHVLERRLGTVVDDGAECLSACALVFMFGTAFQHESNAVMHRRLHVGGRLGFHQPDLTLDRTRAYSVDDVAAAFDLAITATLEFLALAARPRPDTPRPFVDADLLEQMLQHKGQDFFEIDTVNKAGRWGIELIGWQEPPVSEEGVFNACQNMLSWNTQVSTDHIAYADMGYDASIISSADEAFADGQRLRVSFNGMQTYDCEAGLVRDWLGENRPMLCGYRESLSSQVGPDSCLFNASPDLWVPIPGAALLPPETRLSDLRRTRGIVFPDRVGPTPCSSASGEARVINVQSYTSLRQLNDTNSDRIDELPLGSRYNIPRTPEGNWRLPQHQACTALCTAAENGRPYNRSALQACIDANWLWFRITGPSGRTGYASAKYLDY